ncbi:MAG TPA: VCBS repeat-containing protein, partial [Saprospiraceae bacterium]|nr:VCBS repeat-containing protein [Saprospiraceae bacterium]
MYKYIVPIILACSIGFTECKPKSESSEVNSDQPKRFELLPSSKTGITFFNDMRGDWDFNMINFLNSNNGGGVAIGDINNDGLPDVYFSSVRGSNKLYLNKGGLKFEDITEKAGVAAKTGFKTGITMADVNGDGFLDIYVCRTNRDSVNQVGNTLYINN